MHKNRRAILITLSLLCILLVGAYGLYEARAFLRGPILSVVEPLDGATVETPIVTVRGTAHNISKISLNERPIFIDETGVFSEDIALPNGYARITVSVEDRFGNERVVTHEIVVAAPEVSTSPETVETAPIDTDPPETAN